MPYTCDICGVVISRKYDLEHRHARIHTGEAYDHFCPYPDCPRSTRGFSQKGNLNTHINSRHAQGAEKRWYPCRREGCTKTFADASVCIRHEKNARAHSIQFAHWCAADQTSHPIQANAIDATASGRASGSLVQGYEIAGSSYMQQDVNPERAMYPPTSNQVDQAPLPHPQAFRLSAPSTTPGSAVDHSIPVLQLGPGFDRRGSSPTTFQSSTPVSPYGQELPSQTQTVIKPDPDEEYLYPQTQAGTSAIYESHHTGNNNVDVDVNQWFPSSSSAETGSSTGAARQDFQDQSQSSGAGPGPSSSNPNSGFFGYHQWDRY